jgi:tRNA (cmo5U34)-methyltransferase
MTQRHSVQSHMGTSVEDYDRLIRTVIPGYEEMLSTIVWWLSEIVPETANIVELGGGTGALAHAVLTKLPRARLELWDIDPQMIAAARARLAAFEDRVTIRERSFTEAPGACDAVIATIALHHIRTIEGKRAVYSNVFRALASPGILLIGDCTMDPGEPGRSAMYRYWVAFMTQHGITEAEARRHFADWSKEDTYQHISNELSALAQAGFRSPEVFWKQGPMGVYGGIKSDEPR